MNHCWKHSILLFALLARAFASTRSPGYTAAPDAAFAFVPNQQRTASSDNSLLAKKKTFVDSSSALCPPLSTHTRRKQMVLNSAVSSEQSERKTPPEQEKDTLPKNGAKDTTITTEAMSSTDSSDKKKSRLEMPWSDFHSWALRDNLPKYTRILPGATPKTYALWRTMLQDVPELSGYPIHFLQEKCVVVQQANNSQTDATTSSNDTQEGQNNGVAPDVLPYLDNFYFEPSGGLSGQVYGVPGLKDGTAIETSPVGQVEVTIPLGYVLTEDAGIAYELGKPLAESEQGEYYSLEGISRTAGKAASSLDRSVSQGMSEAMSKRGAVKTEEEDPNVMLVRLGASTGMLLAGATAVSMLSHHLTVNVFWV